eukprot:2524166-Heterocapsa_arctica.AAC.1
MLLQETKLLKSLIRGAKGQANRKGRSAVFRPAMASTRNGLNIGGVGVMVKHPRKVREIFPPTKCEHFTKGRWIHAITEGAGGAGLH